MTPKGATQKTTRHRIHAAYVDLLKVLVKALGVIAKPRNMHPISKIIVSLQVFCPSPFAYLFHAPIWFCSMGISYKKHQQPFSHLSKTTQSPQPPKNLNPAPHSLSPQPLTLNSEPLTLNSQPPSGTPGWCRDHRPECAQPER